ncbi:hypothetical protein [Methylobacterium iners]|uniref:hypothetical protein n=1 Tax=Methylobacterium iners TaxID=418707 RepID=UPI001EE200EA|nr:hypothetical protein [Methylobacterium iners]
MPIRPAALILPILVALASHAALTQPAAADRRDGVPDNPFASNYPSPSVASRLDAPPRRAAPSRRSRGAVRR